MSFTTNNSVLYNVAQSFPESDGNGASKERARNNIGAASAAALTAEVTRATNAEKAAKSEVVAGSGIQVTSSTGSDGQSIYTVSGASAPLPPTGSEQYPVFINRNSEFEQCEVIPYVGSQITWTLQDNVTMDSVTTEQDWALGPQRSWPYGFEPQEIDYSAIITTPTDIIVRVYMHEFLYVNETYTPLAEDLVWVGMVKAGTESLQWHICTRGINNNIYTYNGRVTFQTLTPTSGNIVIAGQCGNYHAVPRGFTLGSTPSVQPPPPWTPPNT